MNTPLTEQRFQELLHAALAPLATKADVHREVREAVDDLARIIADTIATPFTERFERLEELLAVKDDVEQLKRQMLEIRSALHLSN